MSNASKSQTEVWQILIDLREIKSLLVLVAADVTTKSIKSIGQEINEVTWYYIGIHSTLKNK